jgi:hypothetical protein
MPTISLTGKDTIKVNDRIFADLADGDVITITLPNDIVNVKTGKNGNSIYALNETGKQADVSIRLIRGSADDKFMNELLATQKNDLPAATLLTLDFAKRIGDGAGNITSDLSSLSGGVFSKAIPDSKENVEGDTETAVAVYSLKFTDEARLLT